MAAATARKGSALVRFLLGDVASQPSLEVLHQTGLVGQAFLRLPDHPARPQLRQAFLVAGARHVRTRRCLAGLVAAWNRVGIVPLVFKGFHLAEFVYAAPGLRAYADVDVVVPEGQIADACAVATSEGWDVPWWVGQPDDLHARHGPEYLGHEAAHLALPEADVRIDVHRRVVHNVHNSRPPERVARRLTEVVLCDAQDVSWAGAVVRLPQPVDAVVVGLALNRCWGSDDWHVKPRDYADMEVLFGHFGLTRRHVLQRAEALGVVATVKRYLRRCDPERRYLDTRRPTWWARRAWNLAIAGERGVVDGVRAAAGMVEFTLDALALAYCMPPVMAARAHGADDVTPRTGRFPRGARSRQHVGARSWRRLRHALHRSARLLRVPEGERARILVYAAHRLLTQRGVRVELVAASPSDADAGAPYLTYRGRRLRVEMGVDDGN